MPDTYRHPEWKRLYDALTPVLGVGVVFRYEEIKAMMDLNPQSNHGRQQFLRCAREIAKNLRFQFECVRGVGYRVVHDAENSGRVHNRMGRAKRRLRDAAFIAIHTRLEELTEQQRAANADILARVGHLTKLLSEQRREIRQVIVGAEPKRLPHPVRDGVGATTN